ncbi:MAG: hypothetical protein IKQ49_09685, partial [Eubacterium sp.]|nr:hypothetical protein [Eubacterium sp.]
MKKRKITTIALAGCLALSMAFTGCGKDAPAENTTAGVATTGSAATESTTTESAATESTTTESA